MANDDEFLDKAVEGLVLFAFNQGEVCTCPSRALIQEDIYDEFMKRCLERLKAIKIGDPLDPENMIGAQVSQEQFEKIITQVSHFKNIIFSIEVFMISCISSNLSQKSANIDSTSPI